MSNSQQTDSRRPLSAEFECKDHGKFLSKSASCPKCEQISRVLDNDMMKKVEDEPDLKKGF
jgi:hypothetical protein